MGKPWEKFPKLRIQSILHNLDFRSCIVREYASHESNVRELTIL